MNRRRFITTLAALPALAVPGIAALAAVPVERSIYDAMVTAHYDIPDGEEHYRKIWLHARWDDGEEQLLWVTDDIPAGYHDQHLERLLRSGRTS